ncbi:hypothetical protein BDZ91DRAFT_713678 [Kalaharituber pfeilii]|nr:hypothetical protein BDZ91DRAFT_713678 [Kalaharituber pfeilii]
MARMIKLLQPRKDKRHIMHKLFLRAAKEEKKLKQLAKDNEKKRQFEELVAKKVEKQMEEERARAQQREEQREEQMRRIEKERRKIEEELKRRREEERRKVEEAERRKQEEEEFQRRREEERRKLEEAERRKQDEELKKKREEEERQRIEEEERKKKNEELKKMQEEEERRMKTEAGKRKLEEAQSQATAATMLWNPANTHFSAPVFTTTPGFTNGSTRIDPDDVIYEAALARFSQTTPLGQFFHIQGPLFAGPDFVPPENGHLDACVHGVVRAMRTSLLKGQPRMSIGQLLTEPSVPAPEFSVFRALLHRAIEDEVDALLAATEEIRGGRMEPWEYMCKMFLLVPRPKTYEQAREALAEVHVSLLDLAGFMRRVLFRQMAEAGKVHEFDERSGREMVVQVPTGRKKPGLPRLYETPDDLWDYCYRSGKPFVRVRDTREGSVVRLLARDYKPPPPLMEEGSFWHEVEQEVEGRHQVETEAKAPAQDVEVRTLGEAVQGPKELESSSERTSKDLDLVKEAEHANAAIDEDTAWARWSRVFKELRNALAGGRKR